MGKITLYHNTSNKNAISISKEGIIAGLRANVYGKGSEAEGSGIWCVTQRGYGYGGATITFEIDDNDEELFKQNDTEYILYRDVPVNEILDIDLQVSSIPFIDGHAVESDIPTCVKKYGKEKLLKVMEENLEKFVEPYNYDLLVNLIETGNKYCKGTIKITESKEDKVVIDWDGDLRVYDTPEQAIKDLDDIIKEYEDDNLCYCADVFKQLRDDIEDGKRKLKYDSAWLEIAYEQDDEESYLLDESKDKRIKEGPYKDGMGMWTIDLADGYVTDYGTDYIQCKTKKDCYYELENFVSAEKIEEANSKVIEWVDQEVESALGFNEKDKLEYVYSNIQRYIRQAGQRINKAQYDYERNKIKMTQSFYKEALEEVKSRLSKLNKIESKKLEEASRNELLAKSKAETITRYNKSAGYKGFSLVDIDTTAIKTRDSIVITNNVGKYFDSIELEDILYWVGLEVTEAKDHKMTQKLVEKALMGAMDGMDIKVDCTCADFCLEENTLIKLLNGEVIKVKDLKDRFDNNDELWVYSTDEKGDFKPRKS